MNTVRGGGSGPRGGGAPPHHRGRSLPDRGPILTLPLDVVRIEIPITLHVVTISLVTSLVSTTVWIGADDPRDTTVSLIAAGDDVEPANTVSAGV